MNQLSNILLVVNPISGNTDKGDLIQKIESRVAQKNIHLKKYHTTGKGDVEKITELLNSFEAHRVLVAGGDGTIKMLAETLRDQNIPLGILPTGSANGLAHNLGISEILDEAIETALGDRLQEIDAICIDNDLCLHIADLGLNAELIKNYENGQIRGKIGYALQAVPTLINSKMPFSFEITTDEGTIHQEGILLGIANASHYGTGARVNPDGKINDGKFEVLIFKKFDVIDIAQTLQPENEPDADFMEFVATTRVKIRCKQAIPFQIDGEYYGEVDQVEAYVLPNHLQIAV
ncbi:diacylglycerol/lipid kinase family protein [Tunicatimonas pelagia]|uniref:diacylglycerol/lipid kinase family protein n=1 Tax=Tunicatimonas pelagia TaxID=931531 RepID=UPI00266655B0|nr:YegS/Rv2252/BmrU family lipid kinase [Tunicatimonas pelagia]WKN41148.1 YegS/Rv2252/BmrU family lipid kinase [Tunicatimonas pelagia]